MSKQIKIFIILICLILSTAVIYGFNLIELTEDTSPTSDDLIYTVNDPSGTPANKKVTLSSLATALKTIGSYLVSSDIGSTVQGYDADTAKTDVAQTWTANQTLPAEKYTILTATPGSPVTGVMYCFDNDTADPNNIAGTDDYCSRYNGASWVAQYFTNGIRIFNSVPMPTLLSSELTDTSTPYVLTSEEVKGTQISNYGATGTETYQFTDEEEGINVIFTKETNQTMKVCPASGDTLRLRASDGTYASITADECIVNTTNEISDLACKSNNAGNIFCGSASANWDEETP